MDHGHERTETARETASSLSESDAAPVAGKEPVSLQAAIRRARLESLERSEVMTDLRGAAAARLDLLREQLEPVFAQLPKDCDMFDLGMTQGERPRLFVDMIAFIELMRDRRGFRFVQDTRAGRVLLAESDNVDAMTQSVADYLARRLIERERALAADAAFGAPPARPAVAQETAQPAKVMDAAPPREAFPPAGAAEQAAERAMRVAAANARAPRPRPRILRGLGRLFMFLVEIVGSAAFFAALAFGGWWLSTHYGDAIRALFHTP